MTAHLVIGKDFTFSAAHRLNGEIYGKCARQHGHNYHLRVEVAGPIDENGWVCDFGILKEIVTRNILEYLDHTDLNERFSFETTAENVGVWIAQAIQLAIKDKKFNLHSVTLWETDTCFARVTFQ